MRASAAYRSEVLGNLMQRFWLESQGMRGINLEALTGVMPGPDPASIAADQGGTGPNDAWIADQVRNDGGGGAKA